LSTSREFTLPKVMFALVMITVGIILNSTEQISLRTADAFLTKYYRQIVNEDTSRTAWDNMLTTSWKQHHGYKEANQFFSHYDSIKVPEVHEQSQNSFTAKLIYVSGDRQTSAELLFRLDCPTWIQKLPLKQCGPNDLKSTR
jgi:hypothetical protein